MARLARAVAPGVAHHVTQRGNRRLPTFFSDGDYQAYIELMAHWCEKRGVAIWGYCLMPNHVHLIAVPETEESLRLAIGEAHRRYSRMINIREGWRGHLWQGRFSSYIMDGGYLMACARYVEMNPVRAGLVASPEDWPWSSARAHLAGVDDELADASTLLEMAHSGWRDFLNLPTLKSDIGLMKKHERTGRPLGSQDFITGIEASLGRRLRPKNAGRPRKGK